MNIRTFVVILSRNPQYDFPKMSGGGQRPFGNFPKIHQFWRRHPSLKGPSKGFATLIPWTKYFAKHLSLYIQKAEGIKAFIHPHVHYSPEAVGREDPSAEKKLILSCPGFLRAAMDALTEERPVWEDGGMGHDQLPLCPQGWLQAQGLLAGTLHG